MVLPSFLSMCSLLPLKKFIRRMFPLLEEMVGALCDALTIAKFFGLLFELLSQVGPNEASLVKGLIIEVLGLDLISLANTKVLSGFKNVGILAQCNKA